MAEGLSPDHRRHDNEATSNGDDTLVELYERITDFGESDLVHAHVPPGAELLELGCGTGRMTRRLLELGHAVTAVDRSEVMLRRAPEAATRLLAEIELLDLGRSFQAVLLASNLVNTPDAARRFELLASCRRHVCDEGLVVVQRYAPSFEGWEDRTWHDHGPIEIRVAAAERVGNSFTASLEYRTGGRFWSHTFTAVLLDDRALREEAMAAGLQRASSLTADESWVALRPAGTR